MLGKFGSLLSFQGHSIGREGAHDVPRKKWLQTKRKRAAESWQVAECGEQLECRTLLAGAGVDINVSQQVGSQIEPSIAVNPTNPLNMAVVGTETTSTSQLFVAYTVDGGQNWIRTPLDSSADQVTGSFQSRFDGSAVFDSFGNLHITYLAQSVSVNTVVYGVSSNGGASFTTRQIEGPSIFIDSPQIAVGPAAANSNNNTVVLTFMDSNGDLVATGALVSGVAQVSNFTASTVFYSNGFFGSGAFNNGNYAVPAVGPDGTVAITWQDPDFTVLSSRILFTSDPDGLTGGLSFPSVKTVLNSNAGGQDSLPAVPSAGSYASPRLAYDLSDRLNQGNLYLIYEDKSTIFTDDTNVFVRISTNNGVTFGQPIRINDDSGANSQFYANISADPVTGALFATWYDARNDTGVGASIDSDSVANTDVELWGSYSTDGGLNWATNVLLSDGASNQRYDFSSSVDFGRRLGVANYSGTGYVAWADNSGNAGNADGAQSSFDILFDSYQYNLPPTLAFVPDITLSPVVINEDSTTGALSFVVSDDLSQAGSLLVSGVSSDQTIVADSGIVFGGTGANRTVSVTPLANRSGPVTITVTVTDDAGLTTSVSFNLNILPQPDPLPAPAGTTTTTTPFSDSTATPLTDNSTTTSNTIAVAGLDPYIYDVDVMLNITHPVSSQLSVVLISPSGTRVTLTSGNGGSLANVFGGSTFDDQIISAPVTDYNFQDNVAAPFLVPEGALAQLRGENPNGNWTLEIKDLAVGSVGTLNGWSLNVTTLPAAPQLQLFSDVSPIVTPVPIPDTGVPLLLPLSFNGLDPFTWDVNLNLILNHTNTSDLDISLISPSGTIILLSSGNGGTNDDVFKSVTFDDQATGGIPVTDASFVNAQAIGPVIPEAALAGFLGENPNGTWYLKVVDHSTNGQVGSVVSWGLDITTIFLNDPPTIGAILNPGAIQEDSGPVSIGLNSISAGGGESQPLSVTATSSDPSLVPNPVVSYTSPLNSAVLTYQPAPDASGVVVISVRVEDGGYDQDLLTTQDNSFTIKTFTVVVNPVNDAPTLAPNVAANVITSLGTVDEDFGTLDVPLTGISAGGGENQKLQVTAVSSQVLEIGNPVIDYIPGASTATMHLKSNADYNGLVVFTVTVMDAGLDNDLLTLNDNLTRVRQFSLFVSPVNDPPTIDPISDPAPINEDAPTQSILLTNLTAGGMEVQPIRVTATISNTDVISDAFVDYQPGVSTGTLLLRPAKNAFGTATITVTVEDGGLDGNLDTPDDNLTTERTFNVSVTQVNDPPVFATLGDVLLLDEDAPLYTVALTGIGAGPLESQELAFSVKSSNASLIPTPVISYTSPGTGGSMTFQPVADASGTSTITLTLMDAGMDGDLSTLNDNQLFTRSLVVVVRAVNDAPTVDNIPDPGTLIEGDGEQEIFLTGITAGDSETQPLKVEAFSDQPLVIPSPLVNYVANESTAKLTFTPGSHQFGTVTISVRVTDGGLDGNLNTAGDNGITTKTFTVNIDPINDAPHFDFIADPAPVDESATPVQVAIPISGVTAGPNEFQNLAFSFVVQDPRKITTPVVDYIPGTNVATLKYTPKPGEFGETGIQLTLTDGGDDNDLSTLDDNRFYSQTFKVRINAANDAPTFDAIPSPLPIDEDSGPQTVPLTNVIAGPANESLQPLGITAVSNNPTLVSNITSGVNGLGIPNSLTYTLAPNRSGTAVITVTLTDGGLDNDLSTPSDNKSTSKQFTITVDPVNDAPSLLITDSNSNELSGNYNVAEDSPRQVLTFKNVSPGAFENQPVNITASVAGLGLNLISPPVISYTSPSATGTLSFTPLVNKSGTAIVNIKVEDGGADGDLSTQFDNLFTIYDLNVNVGEVNDPPTLDPIADPQEINEGAGSQLVTLAGISAGGNEQQSLLVTATSDNPALVANPSVVYADGSTTADLFFTPTAHQSGVAHITVKVDDQHGSTITRTFTVTVNPLNDPPTIDDLGPALNIDEDAGLQTIDLTGISAGVGEVGQLIKVTVSSSRPLTIPEPTLIYTPQASTGKITFESLPDQNGTVVISVKVMDGGADHNLDTLKDNLTTVVNLTVNVAAVPETPAVTIDERAAISKSGQPVAIAPNATLTDPDTTNFRGGGILVQLTDGAQSSDRLTLKATGSNSDRIHATRSGLLKKGKNVIGSITGGTGDVPLTISFSGNVNRKEVQNILRNIQFAGNSRQLGVRTAQVIVTDDTGVQSDPVTRDLILN